MNTYKFLRYVISVIFFFFSRPELLRPGQTGVQQSPPSSSSSGIGSNVHPSGMATSVIRISPNPGRGSLSSSLLNSQHQHSGWHIDNPPTCSYSDMTSQHQSNNVYHTVVTSTPQQQHHHQQNIILQQALTSPHDSQTSAQQHNDNLRDQVRLLKPTTQHTSLALMPVQKNEAIDCSSTTVGNNTLYCVLPQQSSQSEKKYVMIKSEAEKFPAIMVNHIPTSGAVQQSVVVDKTSVLQQASKIGLHVSTSQTTESTLPATSTEQTDVSTTVLQSNNQPVIVQPMHLLPVLPPVHKRESREKNGGVLGIILFIYCY